MILGMGEYENFGSYEHIELDFSDAGLRLIQGPTGAGKSTLFDMPYWCLYGATSKEGAADDVRPWNTKEMTVGHQVVFLENRAIVVTRLRGAGKNDLYWTEEDGREIRGKDLIDTQKLLVSTLRVTEESYRLGAYFHQFSTADQFFLAKAKDRRDLLEKLADLSFPVSIAEGAQAKKKVTKAELTAKEAEVNTETGGLAVVKKNLDALKEQQSQWDVDHQAEIDFHEAQGKAFDVNKKARVAAAKDKFDAWKEANAKKLLSLQEQLSKVALPAPSSQEDIKAQKTRVQTLKETRCPTCGGPTAHEGLEAAQAELNRLQQADGLHAAARRERDGLERMIKITRDQSNPCVAALDAARAEENKYAEWLQAGRGMSNPYAALVAAAYKDQVWREGGLKDLKEELAELKAAYSSLEQVYDLSLQLRAKLLENVVKDLEGQTNDTLSTYFCGAFRVAFTLVGDKLEVEITKDGNVCGFKMLSGGERAMLKVSLALPFMQVVANNCGVKFESIFLDEALNGMDDSLKIQAFALFEKLSLEHGSVFVIDHSPAFQGLFENSWQVTSEGGVSELKTGQSTVVDV